MRLSTEQVQGIVELRVKLQERLEQLRQEVDMTMLNIDALDAALTQSSFTRASEYAPPPKAEPEPPKAEPEPPKAEPEPPKAEPEPAVSSTDDDVSPIMVNDSTIGDMGTSPDKITIKLYVPVSVKTHPFESFFISRIIDDMVDKDAAEVEAGKLSKDSAIRYELKTQDDTLDQIIIYNYRLEERAREIGSTIRWTLSRMLEHAQ